jgi:hypothetical protein
MIRAIQSDAISDAELPSEVGGIGRVASSAPIALRAWMSAHEPDESTWSAFAVFRAST